MTGTLDQDRNRSTMDAPSRSGRPRSRITRSGGCNVADRMPSSAFAASRTAKPSNSKAARRNWRIWSSSSMTRTADLLIVAHCEAVRLRVGCGQVDRDEGAAIGALAESLDLAAVRGHEGLGDPQSEAGPGHVRSRPFAAEEALP